MLDGDHRRGHIGRVVGHNARGGHHLATGGVDQVAQRQGEQLIVLGRGIVNDRHHDGRFRLARREPHHTAARQKIIGRGSEDVGGGVVEANDLAGWAIQHHMKLRQASLLVDHHILHTDHWRASGIVVACDGDGGIRVADDRIGGAVEVDVEALRPLGLGVHDQAVAHHLHRLAGREHQRLPIVVGVVGVVDGGVAVVVAHQHGDLLSAGGAQDHRHIDPAVLLVDHGRQDPDHRRTHRSAVVRRNPGGGFGLGCAGTHQVGNLHHEVLKAFGGAVVNNRYVDRPDRLAGSKHHRSTAGREIAARGGATRTGGGRPGQRHHINRRPVQVDDKRRQACLLVDHRVGNRNQRRA